ncbi:MAG: hypothetical protein ACI86C_000248 [Candidatus Latescibacterota bacterium]|jgi:hypothetical protein
MNKIKIFGVSLLGIMFLASCGESGAKKTYEEEMNAMNEAFEEEMKAMDETMEETMDETMEDYQDAMEVASDALKAIESYDDEEEADEEESSGEDWDAVLEDYDGFVDEYIVLLKKAQEGDMSAMTQYMSVMGKANSLNEKLSTAGDDLSASQMARLVQLQMKLASAASQM